MKRLGSLFLVKRFFRHLLQRLRHGFDDSDTWSMDGAIARRVLPMLCRFKEVTNCHPLGMKSEKWDVILDKMIYAFKWYSDEDRYGSDRPKEVDRGMRLFAKYYPALWW